MNKQQVKGRYEEAKGKVKEVAGHVTGNEDLEVEGTLQKNAGKVQAGIGDAKTEIENVAKDIKKDG
ncbi:CsbD family protein [Rhabdochromatium marinum]|uniref:CsbD family protein n=1 Tax=Rhabdochromatium marinum TaxID=48729 RepID=UPI0019046928|nr:CsbD family protein [Rhabdochromatium marinum]MBK1649212.1 general stress protein CsbD [Rhabdochromatium marinum]